MHAFASIMLQKPAKKSKNKYHVRYFGERLKKWKNRCFDELLPECEMIQTKMCQSNTRQNHDQITKVFTRLMPQGKVSSALRWITDNTSKPLDIIPQVKEQLEEKRPDAAPLATEALINGTPLQLNPCCLKISMPISFSNKPSSKRDPKDLVDYTVIWRSILCPKSFVQVSSDTFDSIARACR